MNHRGKMTAAKSEKVQQRSEAGLVSEIFPKVTKIVISMQYSQTSGRIHPTHSYGLDAEECVPIKSRFYFRGFLQRDVAIAHY